MNAVYTNSIWNIISEEFDHTAQVEQVGKTRITSSNNELF